MVWIALLVVFAFVIGNIMLVKHTAKMKMPRPTQPRQSFPDEEEDDY